MTGLALSPPPAIHRPIEDEEPLSGTAGAFIATADGLSAWAMHTGADRICIYARMARLARGGVGQCARRLHDAGIITLLPQRRVRDGLFDYRAKRTARPFASIGRLLDEDRLSTEDRELLSLIVELADTGRPCGGNRELAALLGIKSEAMVTKRLGKLRSHGLIEVSFAQGRDRDLPVRVIEIVETGAKTAVRL